MRGSRPGERRGGRQRGTKNRRTIARERAQADIADRIARTLGPNAFEGDAHTLLRSIYMDIAQPMEMRLEAARACLPFERPRLAAVQARIEGESSLALLIERSMSVRGRLIDVTPAVTAAISS
jgi:hypothetical protein